MKRNRNSIETILPRLEPIGESGCLVWSGAISTSGYGVVSIAQRMRYVHRLMWVHTHGEIPKGLVIDHLCRVRCCANVAHMEVTSHKTNILRGSGASATHAKQSHCVYGHEFSEDNTWVSKSGARRCRTCNRINARKMKLKQREKGAR